MWLQTYRRLFFNPLQTSPRDATPPNDGGINVSSLVSNSYLTPEYNSKSGTENKGTNSPLTEYTTPSQDSSLTLHSFSTLNSMKSLNASRHGIRIEREGNKFAEVKRNRNSTDGSNKDKSKNDKNKS